VFYNFFLILLAADRDLPQTVV